MVLRRPPLEHFDPDAPGEGEAGIFGLPFTQEESSLILFGYPWEATTSYGQGTAFGPEAIRQASAQLDLFDLELAQKGLATPYRHGIHLAPPDPEVLAWNEQARALAQSRHLRDQALDAPSCQQSALQAVNELSQKVNERVHRDVQQALAEKRLVAVLGGDHSVPLGALIAHNEVAKRYGQEFGILHVDAHADLRVAYEGFLYSHASIMHNVLEQCSQVSSLVQVGIRDLSEAEYQKITEDPRIHTFFGPDLFRQSQGATSASWAKLCESIVAQLPPRVYISFDIDGLDPSLCPHTGTPVPGGLGFEQAQSLLLCVIQSGRTVIGFDLCEVSPPLNAQGQPQNQSPADQWDANVGARILYRLCGILLHSQGARDFGT